MSGKQKRGTRASPSSRRFQIGEYWLWYRDDRDVWNICYLEGRTTRRRGTGIGGGGGYPPPESAQKALAKWVLDQDARQARAAPAETLPPGEVLMAVITTRWLKEHVAELEDPARYLTSLDVWKRFYDHQRALPAEVRVLREPFTVGSVTNALVDAFIAFRRAEDASAPTISRDLAALRGPINWALGQNIISAAPRVKDVKGKDKKKELEWSPEQVAAILEAAWASLERRHVHLFSMIHCSTHGRTEAILELDAETQIRQGLIYFNAPGRQQTRKRRSIVPVCPTLAPWLDGLTGKVIRYRVPTSAKTRAAGGPDFYERPTSDIGNAFAGVLIEAHRRHPELGLARQKRDDRGNPLWLPPRRKLGEVDMRPDLAGIGSPNTLRHTIHTWHKRRGVPDAQIDAASGHSEQGTGAHYTHLRPEYLREFVESTEAFWEAVGEFTDTHLRYQRDTKVVSIAATKARR
jgi:site-specific recombinase XerD